MHNINLTSDNLNGIPFFEVNIMSDIVPGNEEDFIRKIQEELLKKDEEETASSSESGFEIKDSDDKTSPEKNKKTKLKKQKKAKKHEEDVTKNLSGFLRFFFIPFIIISSITITSFYVKNIFATAGISVISVILLGLYFKVLLRNISNRKFDKAEEILNEIAKGNLQFNLKDNPVLQNQLGRLAEPIGKVIKEVSDVITKMELSALDIVGNSDALSYFAASMAKNTDQHEDSIKKIDGSAKKLNDSMQNIRRNVETAFKNSKISITEAETSSSEILSLIEEMNTINDLSDKILTTMNFISEIADETNLLALNAAIQAAHAGDEGKGFGVVATEIRSLSESSSKAAKTIYQTIEQTIDSIVKGVSLSEQAKKALTKIITLIKSTEDLMSDVNDDINIQTDTTNKLTQSVENVQGLTKDINSDTQNMKSAIVNLAAQSQVLKDIVKGFDVHADSLTSDSIIGVENN